MICPVTFAVRFPRALIFVDCHMLRSPFGFAQIVLSAGNPGRVLEPLGGTAG